MMTDGARFPGAARAATAVVVALAILASACTPTTSPSPSSSASPTGGSSPTPSASASVSASASTSPSTSPSGTASASPSASPSASLSASPSASGPATAQVTFELDLVGAVPFGDRFSVSLSIDGTDDIHGFCGFGPSDVCSPDKLYTWMIPSVAIGSDLEWEYRHDSLAMKSFAGGSTTLNQGLSVKASCIYNPNIGSDPVCARIQ